MPHFRYIFSLKSLLAYSEGLESLIDAKLIKSVTAISHCMFGIIATAGDKIKFSELCDLKSVLSFF